MQSCELETVSSVYYLCYSGSSICLNMQKQISVITYVTSASHQFTCNKKFPALFNHFIVQGKLFQNQSELCSQYLKMIFLKSCSKICLWQKKDKICKYIVSLYKKKKKPTQVRITFENKLLMQHALYNLSKHYLKQAEKSNQKRTSNMISIFTAKRPLVNKCAIISAN